MKAVVGLSLEPESLRAVDEACRMASGSLGATPDLCFVFATMHHSDFFGVLPRRVLAATGCRVLIGCTGAGIICGKREYEGDPGLAVWMATLPGVGLEPFHIGFRQEGEDLRAVGFPSPGPQPARAVVVLPEPFTTPGNALLQMFGDAYPLVPLIGGMAAGGVVPGQNRLFCGDRSLNHGAVGVVLTGNVNVRTVVSQGCRPIGKHMVITAARNNVIEKLGGRPACDVFREVFAELPPDEQDLARRAVCIGRVINEYQEKFGRGDFLIRNMIGFDENSGALVVSENVRVGQTVQFHVRDGAAAREELSALLAADRRANREPPSAGLVFSCNGRGQEFYGEPDQDAATIQGKLGEFPLAGFFAQGEIGPVGGKNFLHGYTASMAFLSPPG